MQWTEIGITLAKLVLILYSVLSVAVIAERFLVLKKAETSETQEFEKLKNAAKQGSLGNLVGDSATAQALNTSLKIAKPSDSNNTFTDAVGRSITEQGSRAQNRLSLLATVASTAPYVGLFGTVLGILGAFAKIAKTGETGASIVSGSISEALITTAIGLGVAIPAVIAYNYFNGRVERYLQTIEKSRDGTLWVLDQS